MKIAAYGCAEDQASKLARILKLSRTHPYQLIDFDPQALPDLLLVFGLKSLQHTAVTQLPASYHARLVVVERGRPEHSNYPLIGYPLVSSRVLQALDALTSANEEYPETAPPGRHGSDNRFARYAEAPPTASPTSAPTSNAYRVLVVDDSKAMQHALALELQAQFGTLAIDFADDGTQALARVAAERYDFIFLDIMMPGIDGFETCTHMRQLPALKKTPIIMLSSKTSPLDEVKGIMAGSSTYLTKPIVTVEFQQVMARIRRWIEDFRQPGTCAASEQPPQTITDSFR